MSQSRPGLPIPQLSNLQQLLITICFLSFFLFLPFPSGHVPPYFFDPRTYVPVVVFLSLLAAFFVGFNRFAAGLFTGIVAVVFFAYGCLEVVFSYLPPPETGWVSPPTPWMVFTRELYNYAGNRALQILPIAIVGVLLSRFLSRHWRHRLQLGQVNAETTILGGAQAQPWKQVAARLAAYMSIVLIGFLAARGVTTGGSERLLLFSSRLIGGSVNSLVEELLFRGILQPVFETFVTLGAANALQAGFFAVIHFGYIESMTLSAVAPEVGRILLYTLIGWFLGRAARETNGLLVPWFFHALITASIWVLLTVQGS